jgi:hypothetical protein
VIVRDNIGAASGPSATAQGGGIWNGPLLSGPPVVPSQTGTRRRHLDLATGESTASKARPAVVAAAPLRNSPAVPSPDVAGSANQA